MKSTAVMLAAFALMHESAHLEVIDIDDRHLKEGGRLDFNFAASVYTAIDETHGVEILAFFKRPQIFNYDNISQFSNAHGFQLNDCRAIIYKDCRIPTNNMDRRLSKSPAHFIAEMLMEHIGLNDTDYLGDIIHLEHERLPGNIGLHFTAMRRVVNRQPNPVFYINGRLTPQATQQEDDLYQKIFSYASTYLYSKYANLTLGAASAYCDQLRV